MGVGGGEYEEENEYENEYEYEENGLVAQHVLAHSSGHGEQDL